MRRRPTVVGAVFAAALLWVLLPGSASGAGVQRQAWAQTGSVPVGGMAAERLYVAAIAGEEQARAFIQLDVAGLSAQQIAAGRLVLAEDTTETALAETAEVAACAVTDAVADDGRIEQPPEVDCSFRVPAAREADGRWVVELGAFADHWSTPGSVTGVALLPAAPQASGFRLSFDPTMTGLDGLDGSSPTTTTSTTVVGPPASGPVEDIDDVEPGVVVAPPPGNTAPPFDATSTFTTTTTAPPAGEGLDDDAVDVDVARAVRPAATPPALALVVVLAAGAALFLAALHRRGRRVALPPRLTGERGVGTVGAGAALAIALLPLSASEIVVYKSGLLLIFLVAALGLHVLVNWAGQLSLAHAGMVGLPAFAVVTISEIHGISPIYLLPVGMAIGAACGAAVGLPTLRARGLQVALVTLAAGIAIDRFFFTKPWLVGPVGGRTAATPSFGPLEFTTTKGLYPVLVAVVAVTLVGLWALMHSRTARAWFWVRADADAAAAFGVPTGRYRIAAFTTAGALAGLAGALTIMWVQQSSAGAFPPSLSFSYLLVTVLAGPGYAGGVAVAVLLLQGGHLFLEGVFGRVVDDVIAYAGPIALVFNVTVYKAGFNGVGRKYMDKLRARRRTAPEATEEEAPLPGSSLLAPLSGAGAPESGARTEPLPPLQPAFVGGVVAVVAGFGAIGLAWYHAGNTSEVWVQNQEMISGGGGGIALVLLGVGLLIRDRIGVGQARLAAALEALAAQARSETQVTTPPVAEDESGRSARRHRAAVVVR